MNIKLYTISKKSNSTKQPASTAGDTYVCTLKNPCSVINPVIDLEHGTQIPVSYNYAYIADFSRYYFIQDWTYINGIWEATMEVDVLASYKTQIGLSELYVLRSASDYNGAIVDNFYPTIFEDMITAPVYAPNNVTTYKWNGTSLVSTTHTNYWTRTFLEGAIILSVIDSTVTGGIKYFCVEPYSFVSIINQLMNISLSDFDDVSDGVGRAIANPIQFISRCYWLPSGPPNYTPTKQTIKFGYYDVTNIWCQELGYSTDCFYIEFNMTLLKHALSEERGEYLNGSPYTTYKLSVPNFGVYTLSNIELATSSKIWCKIYIDIATGKGELYVNSGSGAGNLVLHDSGLYGVEIPVVQLTQDVIGAVAGIAGAGAGLITGLATKDVAGAITSAASGIMSAAQSISPQTSSKGSQGVMLGHCLLKPTLYTTFVNIVDEDNEHKGRPLCEDKVINTLSGYIECRDGDIEISGATSDEIDKISGFLTGGFFYE